MITLTYTDFYNQMGLSELSPMNPVVGAPWESQARISMGNRLKGDALLPGWIAAIPDQPSGPNTTWLTTNWWSDLVGWIVISPAATNTCTNACVSVYDFQVQIFNTTTNKWELASGVGNRGPLVLKWWTTDTFIVDGTADNIYPGRSNIPRFCNVKVAGDRATSSADTAKYRLLHNGFTRITFADPSVVGGIAIMCRAKIEPISGSLNATPQILMQIGGDAMPKPTIIAGQDVLDSITNTPAIGGSAYKLLSTTEQVFLFTTANINSNTYKETSSAYSQSFPAGTYPMCMSNSLFRANVPQFISF